MNGIGSSIPSTGLRSTTRTDAGEKSALNAMSMSGLCRDFARSGTRFDSSHECGCPMTAPITDSPMPDPTPALRFDIDGTVRVPVNYWLSGPMGGHVSEEVHFLHGSGPRKHVIVRYRQKGGGVIGGTMLARSILDGKKDISKEALDA